VSPVQLFVDPVGIYRGGECIFYFGVYDVYIKFDSLILDPTFIYIAYEKHILHHGLKFFINNPLYS
jgi:hypothetical protein